jgi:dipeptidyl aminopeptidase/acylaminoacyl peptidase
MGTGTRFTASALVVFGLVTGASGSAHATRSQLPPALLVFETDRGTGNANVAVASDQTGGQLVTSDDAEDIQPALSPTGRLAFASDRKGNYDIYATQQGVGGGPFRVTKHEATDYSPAWLGQSGLLAFVSDRRGNADIYVIQASESAIAGRVTGSAGDDIDPAWSPRGVGIAFASDRSGTYDIWIVSLGTTAKRVTSGVAADFEPAWSPDGSELAFTRRREDGNYDIYALDVAAGKARRLTSNASEDSEPTWSPDGRYIAFVSDRDGDYDIWLMNPDGSQQHNFSRNSAPFDVAPNWQPPETGEPRATRWVTLATAAAARPAAVDRPAAANVTCEIKGNSKNNELRGKDGNDGICGYGGNDVIYGGPGDDEIVGGPGKDTIYGGPGNDIIRAKEGRDRIFGGPGKDKIVSKDGSRDRIRGGLDRDRARTDERKLDKGWWEGPL